MIDNDNTALPLTTLEEQLDGFQPKSESLLDRDFSDIDRDLGFDPRRDLVMGYRGERLRYNDPDEYTPITGFSAADFGFLGRLYNLLFK